MALSTRPSVLSSASSHCSGELEPWGEIFDKEIPTGILPGITSLRTSFDDEEEFSSAARTNRSTSALIEKNALSSYISESANKDTELSGGNSSNEGNAQNERIGPNERIGQTSPIENKNESQSGLSNTISNTAADAEKRSSKDESQARSSHTAINTVTDTEKESPRPQNSDVEIEWKRPISNGRWYLTCVGMLLGAILYGLDTTIAADIQSPILRSLGEIEKLGWVGIGFPMGSVSIILLVGCSYGLFEIKWLLIGFLILFSGGSAICGAAPTMNALIIGRVVAGIGGAGTYLGALTYVSKFTSPKEQPIYNGLIGLFWGAGTILGPLVGGGFSESSLTWRWSFYINLPLTALLSPIYLFVFPKHNPAPEIHTWSKLKSIDWVGAVLNAIVFSLFQIVLTFAGSEYAWGSILIITLWSVFGVSLVAYILQQTLCIFTTPERRIFPIQFLKSRTMILLYTGTAAATTGLGVSIYYIPIFFQFAHGDSAIQAAVRLLPLICVYVSSLIVSSASLPSWGRYSPLYIGAGMLLIVGGALMHTIKIDTAKGYIYGYEVLIALGAGIISQTGYSVAVTKVKPNEVPSALGFMNVAQIGTAAIALSIADCIFQNIGFIGIRNALSGYGFTDQQLRSALAGSQSSLLAVGNPAIIGAVLTVLTETIDKIWLMIVTAGAVSLVAGILMKHEKLKLEVVAGG